MNLSIDIGNTRSKLAIFKKEKLVKKEIWESIKLKEIKALLKKWQVKNIIVSETGNISPKLEAYFHKHFFYINLDHKTALPIKNLYKTPKTLGDDRLAAVVAGHALFPGKNILVVDAGTCITYDLLNKKGEYLGGNISPGLRMRFAAMQHFTDKLPEVQPRKMEKPYGDTTVSAMRIGAQMGLIHEFEGFSRQYKVKMGNIKLILTGGDANFFVKNIKTKIFVNQNLVLTGLNKILNYNVQNPK